MRSSTAPSFASVPSTTCHPCGKLGESQPRQASSVLPSNNRRQPFGAALTGCRTAAPLLCAHPAASSAAARIMSFLLAMSNLGGRFPLSACHRRNELSQPARRERERFALLGALVRCHQELHH